MKEESSLSQVNQISNCGFNIFQNIPTQMSLRILHDSPENQGKKVVAVIITIFSGSSYDSLFQSIQQQALEGTVVEVYTCDSLYLEHLISAFEGHPQDQIAKRMVESMIRVDTDCVVVNWECCSGYSCQQFPQKADRLFYFLKEIIDRGHMAMFSDFSLKALINQWDQKYGLGPNPFVRSKDEHGGDTVIRFCPKDLKECPSAQLHTVGDLSENGICHMIAAGGTIIYYLDKSKLNHNRYTHKVLTVVPDLKPSKKEYVSQADNYDGSAGHVLLTYPSGGMILTSMGHWIQLMNIDTSAEKLFQMAEREYSLERADFMRKQYSLLDQCKKQAYLKSCALNFVQNQAPCSNMIRKQRNNR